MDRSDEKLRGDDVFKSSDFPGRRLTRAEIYEIVELATRNPRINPDIATLLLCFESAFIAGWRMVLSRF